MIFLEGRGGGLSLNGPLSLMQVKQSAREEIQHLTEEMLNELYALFIALSSVITTRGTRKQNT